MWRKVWLTIAAATLLALNVSASFGDTPSAEQISTAIERLGAANYEAREEAADFLWRAGPVAREALEAASKSDDHEVATRAKGILEKVRYGIAPDTSPEVMELISKYRGGDTEAKRFAVLDLLEKDQLK